MSALTYEVKNPRSPVAVWLRSRFPDHKPVQAEFRVAAGAARVMPSQAVAQGTQGAAIDWWIRFLVDPAPGLELAATGLARGEVKFGSLPCFDVGLRLLQELGGLDDDREPQSIDPARITGREAEWQARVCYSLALLVEPLRAYSIEGSRLMRLDDHCGVRELLALANDAEVTDLIAMRDLACECLLPALPAGVVTTGPTFDGSHDLNADADLIAGGMLVDVKAGQGGNPRKDGTRAAQLGRDELDQLIGYTLMDYSDTFRINTLAIYAARFGHLATWPVDELLTRLAGQPIDLAALREDFSRVLRVDLPRHWRATASKLRG
ncbi:MAG: hypothetical protein ACRDS0_01660 [Pseudonocardiaceae bacterium]